MHKLILSLAAVIAGVAMLATPVFAATTTVSPSNMQGWGFGQETPTGSGSMVTGPGTPPLGNGSANLIVDSTGGEVLAKSGYQGLRFDAIDTLEYSTYRTSGAPALAIALQFDFDNNVTDADNTFKGRIVYEPYHTQTVTTGEWQTWDTLDDAAGTGTGNWWLSNGVQAAASGCTQANPCTWAEILTAFPDGGIRNTTNPNVWLKAGGGWTGGFNGNVDALMINGDTYDFELANVPSNKDQCKKDGWKTLTDNNAQPFKNQGQCVSYFNNAQ
jgi:hypothetical protein